MSTTKSQGERAMDQGETPLDGELARAPDRELLERWAASDSRAGDELIHRHFVTVHRFLRNKVADDNELEDLIQQTMLGCVESRGRYRHEASFKTFLLSIARNQLFLYYRRARRTAGELSSSTRDEQTSLSGRYARRQNLAQLTIALAHLPSEFREVLVLSYWDELDVPTIAELLGTPLNTAYTRLRRAKLALRAVMENLEVPKDGRPSERDP